MDLSTITVADFKARFYRDFTFGSVPVTAAQNPANLDVVTDNDINNAYLDAMQLFNQGLFGDDTSIRVAYLYLAAHCLCMSMRIAAGGGGINSSGSFPVSSRSVGSVSEAYAIPDAYKDSAVLAIYTQTSYGIQYLEMVLPKIVGNVVGVYGGTHA